MISVGSLIPAAPGSLWVEKEDNTVSFPSSGKYIIVGVPGAFTPPCSSQVPGYVENYDKLKEKGVRAVYIVAVNDIFVVNAWKEKLAEGSETHFLSDSQGEFTKSVGLDFDAAGLLGNTRSKRYVAVVDNGKVVNLQIEDEVSKVTVTHADNILKNL
ncbi:Redoxin [Choiromyces venosus 120613-1]|uniref:Redoxin n=1 Tax=Choiromyces venosus 120613-1 TaxID=1336337 RepID=A0A3N4JSM9_9PEZI|nr:Redoxin [Choiromyces venosus 120613-1]